MPNRRADASRLDGPLFRLDGAVERHPDVDEWMKEHPGPLGDIAREWLKALHACGDDVREVVHDGAPTACVQGAAFAYVNAFTSHVSVGFFHGASLDDPSGLLEGAGKNMRHVKLRPGGAVPPSDLQRLICDAYVDIKRRLKR